MPPTGIKSCAGGAFPGLFHGLSVAGCRIRSSVGGPVELELLAAAADLETPWRVVPAAFEVCPMAVPIAFEDAIAACPRSAASLGLEEPLDVAPP